MSRKLWSHWWDQAPNPADRLWLRPMAMESFQIEFQFLVVQFFRTTATFFGTKVKMWLTEEVFGCVTSDWQILTNLLWKIYSLFFLVCWLVSSMSPLCVCSLAVLDYWKFRNIFLNIQHFNLTNLEGVWAAKQRMNNAIVITKPMPINKTAYQ